MNKLEIICYIISAFFMGISAGCLISAGIHRRVWGSRRKRKLQNIDEIHEHRDAAVYDAIKRGMAQKTRPVTPFFGTYRDEVFVTLASLEGLAEDQQRRKAAAARRLLGELEKAGAISYDIKVSEIDEYRCQQVLCVAKLDVVMPEKEATT